VVKNFPEVPNFWEVASPGAPGHEPGIFRALCSLDSFCEKKYHEKSGIIKGINLCPGAGIKGSSVCSGVHNLVKSLFVLHRTAGHIRPARLA
jgi:hypothetical protein